MRDVYKNIIEKALVEHETFNGVVSISDLSGERSDFASGLAERVFGVPVNTETRFGIASGTKGFTAIKILQLIEEGKLELESKLVDILPGVFEHMSDHVTIKHVLMHTSGMPDYFDEEVMDDFAALWDTLPMYKVEHPKDLLPLYSKEKMKFQPGERFSYNNGGFIALGLVIEALTKNKYQDEVYDSVFVRSGMKTAGFDRFDSLKENSAFGYIYDPKEKSWRSNIYALPVNGNADGGAFVNVHDMDAFWTGLLNNDLINDTTFQMLNENQIHVARNIHYSLGFWTKRSEDSLECIYLMGEDPGVSFVSVLFPKTGIKYTVQSNTTDGAWDIHDILYDEVKKLIL